MHFVLQGSVQRNGTKIRINAQLADATSNAQLWSDTFEGDQSDLFALQDRVTTLVGNSIGREMVIVAARESESRKSSPKVADLMLRARALDLKPAVAEELAADGGLVPPGAGAGAKQRQRDGRLGRVPWRCKRRISVPTWMKASKRRKFVEARDLALKAKELDPDNPGVYVPIAMYALDHGDWEGALTCGRDSAFA